MTINDYLGQIQRLKYKVDAAKQKMEDAESRVYGSHSSLNFKEGVPISRTGSNSNETRLIDYVDAGREYIAAYKAYKEYREQLQKDFYNLPHWQALTLEQIYIVNIRFNDEKRLDGVKEILNAKTDREMRSKIADAKRGLAKMLREQGLDIEE